MPSIISELHAARRQMLEGKARQALDAISGFDTPFASLSIVRGECYYVLGEWSAAIHEFEEALRLSPNSPRPAILLELSVEMMELEKTIRPAASIEQLLGVPNESEVVPPLPKISLPRDSAMESLDVPTTLDEIGLVSETLADVMIEQGKFDEARKVYIQLSRLNPDRYEHFRARIRQLDDRI